MLKKSFDEFIRTTSYEPQKRWRLLFGSTINPGYVVKAQVVNPVDPLKTGRAEIYMPAYYPKEATEPGKAIWGLPCHHTGINDQGSYAPPPKGTYAFVTFYEGNVRAPIMAAGGGYTIEKHHVSHDGAYGKSPSEAAQIGTNVSNIGSHVESMVSEVMLPTGAGGAKREAPDKDHHHEDYLQRTQAGNVLEMSDDRKYMSVKNSSQHRFEIDQNSATLSVVADDANYISVTGARRAIKSETEKLLDKSVEKASWVGTNFIQFVGGEYNILVSQQYALKTIKGTNITCVGDINITSASNIISMGATNTISALGPANMQPSLTPGGAAIPINNYTNCLFVGVPHGLNFRCLVGPI